MNAAARACHGCGADLDLGLGLHRSECPELRSAQIAPPPWRVLRLARDERGVRLEALLENCNRKARAWLAARGRAFP